MAQHIHVYLARAFDRDQPVNEPRLVTSARQPQSPGSSA